MGALFHSADGGATWNRAAINFEGNTVTETIVGIQLRDPQHLTVTTASGSNGPAKTAAKALAERTLKPKCRNSIIEIRNDQV